ncbi:MAG TPA: archaellin/type IV pilin N-terminal domain-containing protein [Thermoplasmata archaeon]|nr:archaellin/type IV pilin N-terminal domain-containing protein [Thermoplasmata archaeon]
MSPIIATILLVAITVVLAAVLYVLISGLTKGPGSTPLGSALGVGSATGGACGGAPRECNYTVSVVSASGGLTPNSLKFQLEGSSNNITSFNNVIAKDSNGCFIGLFTAVGGWSTTNPAWTGIACTASGGLTTLESSGCQFALSTGASLSGKGYQLVFVAATGSFSGTVPASIP